MKKKGVKVKKVILKKKSVKNKIVKKNKSVSNNKVKRKSTVGKIKVKGEFVWTSKMSVHEGVIDSQHKTLLEQINKLIESINPDSALSANRAALHFLGKYTAEHFSYEEGYMKSINYPKLDEHRKMHQGFVSFFEKLSLKFDKSLYSKMKPGDLISDRMLKLTKECKNFLGKWLVGHIMGADHAYAVYAEKHESNGKKSAGKKGDKQKSGKVDVASIAEEIKNEMIKQQRAPVEHLQNTKLSAKKGKERGVKEYVTTGVPGFDDLFDNGIPKGNLMIVAGGAGSGKTIFCLQTLVNKAREGKKCLYMTLEESEDKLVQHMEDFGWNASELVKKGKLKIFRMNPFDITRNVDALLAKQKGELLIDIDPVILPDDYKHPDFIVIDSLTAISSAFTGKEESYRVYIEQLFRFLEKTEATGFLITETEQIPKIFSPTGVEEFLADGVIVIYNLKHGNVRENAIEVLKLRGAGHQKKIVAMQITSNGVVVYPEQEVFSDIE